MYEVNTTMKTLLTTDDETEAIAFAESIAKDHVYVAVMRVVSTSPWYAESVKIFMR